MKQRFTLLWLFFVLSYSANAVQWIPLTSQSPSKSKVEFLSGSLLEGTVSLELKGYSMKEVSTPRGQAFVVESPGAAPILRKGAPDLPQFAASVIIPDQGTLSLTVVNAEYTDYPNVEIAPSKGNLYRTTDPATVAYSYAPEYSDESFWPSEITGLRPAYILRDFRGQTILLHPFCWNPVTKVLRVYTRLEIKYTCNTAQSGENELQRAAMPQLVDKDYFAVYKNQFVNSPAVQYLPLAEEGKMLIICEQAWMNEMQRFVDWKTRKGIPVEMVSVQSIGATTTAIDAYITNYYQNNGLTFVLLVGDAPQIPSPSLSGGASDPSYGYILGSDAYAEVMIGRFSAESAADVAIQVDRVLNYEQINSGSDNWLATGVVIGSDQGPGDDGEMDWEHAVNMRSDMMAFTYPLVHELYDGTHSGTTDAPGDPVAADLFSLFQSGLGIMTYTGHGSTLSCSTTGLSVTDVNNMTNTNQLPFIWSVACVNGEFDAGVPCLAEAFLRAKYNDQPTGAIATYMSSINQSWNPPMDGQDEMVDLLTNVYPSMNRRTFGGLSVNGCMHMNDNYGAAGTEMTDTWHCFGDPSLNVRTAPASPLTVSHPGVVLIGMNSLSVNVSSDSALVAVVLNGQILATGISVNGVCNLNFPALSTLDTLNITVTGFNLQTYQSVIPVIPASGPYVAASGGSILDASGNNDGFPDFGEAVTQDIVLTNFGSADAFSVNVTITTSDPYVTITNGTFTIPSINSSAIQTVSNQFAWQAAANVPDMHVVSFDVVVTDGNSTWNSTISQVIHAPSLSIGLLSVDDSQNGNNNQILESGETATVKIACINSGHSTAPAVAGLLSSLSNSVTITNPALAPTGIVAGGNVQAQFDVTLASNMITGTAYDLTLSVANGAYTADKTFVLTAGIVVETFETNNFSSFNWLQGGDMPWVTTTVLPYEGLYCAVSGAIDDDEISDLFMTINVPADDSVTFWYRLETEATYDFLNFYIDNTMMGQWSGFLPWTYTGFAITPGNHTIRWSYTKDFMVSSGADCSWLDHIRLPAGTSVTGIFHADRSTNGLLVYPNPAANQLNVIPGVSGKALVQILDMSGRKLYSEERVIAAETAFMVPVSGLSSGIYTLQLLQDGDRKNTLFQVSK